MTEEPVGSGSSIPDSIRANWIRVRRGCARAFLFTSEPKTLLLELGVSS